MLINKIIFYTPGHNGDIHYSREFVKDIIKKIPNIPAEYWCNSSKKILKDIHSLKIKPFNLWGICKNNFFYDLETKTVYINTWVGCDYSVNGEGKYGCCLKSNYFMYKQIFNFLNIKIENEEYYIPSIDSSFYDTLKIDEFFKNNHYKFYCLISNGNVLSGQAENLNLNNFIKKLALNFKNTCFILTDSSDKIYFENVFYTDDIINTTDGDLNEIAHLSTKCNIIVGRASGPFCFCHNKNNLYDKKKIFIVFTHAKPEGTWVDDTKIDGAKHIWSNNFDLDLMHDTISNEIKNIL
jgi:hypothetical protein